MKLPVLNIQEVAERHLCTGCGACAAVEPDRFRMGDADAFGRRPFLVDDPADETGDGLKVCPGASLEHTFDRADSGLIDELTPGWGPVREVWEGYAADDGIRRAGSSGGAATALALFAIERAGMGGVLHTAASDTHAWLNRTVYSTTRDELFARTGRATPPRHPAIRWASSNSPNGPASSSASRAMSRRLRPRVASAQNLTRNWA